MATYEGYKGLKLPEALQRLAELHGPGTSAHHLSSDEVTLLERCAKWMEENGCTTETRP